MAREAEQKAKMAAHHLQKELILERDTQLTQESMKYVLMGFLCHADNQLKTIGKQPNAVLVIWWSKLPKDKRTNWTHAGHRWL